MPVFAREIKSGFQAGFLAGADEFAHEIAPAAAPRALSNRIIGGFGGPEAKAFVTFDLEDEAFGAGGFGRLRPLPRVEFGGIEKFWIFLPGALIFAGEGVQAEANKKAKFILLPF